MTQPTNSTSPHITQVRSALLATLADLRNRDNPMDLDRAKAVATVATVLVDTARVENDYFKITGQDRSDFLEQLETTQVAGTLPTGISSITRHMLKG